MSTPLHNAVAHLRAAADEIEKSLGTVTPHELDWEGSHHHVSGSRCLSRADRSRAAKMVAVGDIVPIDEVPVGSVASFIGTFSMLAFERVSATESVWIDSGGPTGYVFDSASNPCRVLALSRSAYEASLAPKAAAVEANTFAPSEPPIIDPGLGWRNIEAGEPLQDGDEWQMAVRPYWGKMTGALVGAKCSGRGFRRRLPAPAPAVEVLPPGWGESEYSDASGELIRRVNGTTTDNVSYGESEQRTRAEAVAIAWDIHNGIEKRKESK